MEYQTIVNPDGTISIVPVNQQQGIMVPAYETSQLDLVDQINQGPRNIGVPMTLEQTMAGSVLPPDPRRFQSIFPTTGIMQQAPLDMNRFQGVSDMSIIDETTNDEQDQNYIDQVNKNKSTGIMDLIMSIAIPGYGFLKNIGRGSLEGIRGLNQRIQQSDFGRSKTLADYFDARSYGGRDARDRAAEKTMRDARGIQTKIDTGRYRRTAADDVIDRGRGQNFSGPTKSAAATRSRDLGSMRGGVGR